PLTDSGRVVAPHLLQRARDARTLPNHPKPDDPLARRITAYPLDFENGDRLVAALTDADTLYNTYWVRAPRGSLTHRVAVENTRRLIAAADRKSTRLNSSHQIISYAVFCLKKKNINYAN